MIRIIVTGLLMVFVAATPSAAQVQVDLVAYGGLYAPLSNLADSETVDPVEGTIGLSVGQSSGLAVGARADLWLSRAWGLEGNFAYAISEATLETETGVGISDLCSVAVDCGARVWMGSLLILYQIYPDPDADWSIHFGGGGALISHSGKYWEDIDNTTDFGGVIQLGFAADFTPTAAFRFDAESYLYSYSISFEDPDLGPVTTESKFQTDMVFSGAFVFHLGR